MHNGSSLLDCVNMFLFKGKAVKFVFVPLKNILINDEGTW